MPKITARGPSISDARTLPVSDVRARRRAHMRAVASTVVSEEGEVEVSDVVVPTGTVAEIVAWIGDDTGRAAAAKNHDLSGVRKAAAKLLDE